MKLHELKIKKEYFADVNTGIKSFELRKNDREYKVGDYIHFSIVDGNKLIDTYPLFKIVYILENVKEYGLEDGFCILGIRKMREAE